MKTIRVNTAPLLLRREVHSVAVAIRMAGESDSETLEKVIEKGKGYIPQSFYDFHQTTEEQVIWACKEALKWREENPHENFPGKKREMD